MADRKSDTATWLSGILRVSALIIVAAAGIGFCVVRGSTSESAVLGVIVIISILCSVSIAEYILAVKAVAHPNTMRIAVLLSLLLLIPGILAMSKLVDEDIGPVWALFGAIAGYLFGDSASKHPPSPTVGPG